MTTPARLLRASHAAPINVRPQLGLRLQFAGGFVPYVLPTLRVEHGITRG